MFLCVILLHSCRRKSTFKTKNDRRKRTFKKQTYTKVLALRKNFTGSKKICLQRAVCLIDLLHNRGLVVQSPSRITSFNTAMKCCIVGSRNVWKHIDVSFGAFECEVSPDSRGKCSDHSLGDGRFCFLILCR